MESRARVSRRRWIMADVQGRCGGRMIRGRWVHRSCGGGTSPPRIQAGGGGGVKSDDASLVALAGSHSCEA
jgi:hypothetical protein